MDETTAHDHEAKIAQAQTVATEATRKYEALMRQSRALNEECRLAEARMYAANKAYRGLLAIKLPSPHPR